MKGLESETPKLKALAVCYSENFQKHWSS